MKMSTEVQKAVAECRPGLIATADQNGKPNVSAKGSLRVIDDEHLLFADVASPRTVANLKDNPQVGGIRLNPPTRKGCRIWGKAEIISYGDLFNQVSQEMAARNMKVNHVVRIAVEDALAF